MDQSTLIQIAFSLYSNRGAYALLLGSGISRAAGIPTGWEITVDLIRQIASLHGEECAPDPEKWYANKFGNAPGYSDLLDHLGKTPTERNNFIKPFIEPTEEERAEGRKQPTTAHRAIAKLVASGVIKVIITTNFDRLIERAIEDEGIVPTVISSPDGVDGATPIIHSACTIIKLNGDYLDTRSKNTPLELLEYDPKIIQLLERVFDEFGLFVCGWSGEWDTRLCSIIEGIKGRRYSCYWAAKGQLSEKAHRLANLRSAMQFTIQDADTFFSALEEKIAAIAALRQPHPLSPELAVVSLKKFIAEDKYRVRLHDLLMNEVTNVCQNIAPSRYPFGGPPVATKENMEQRIHDYGRELHTLIPLMINGAYWGGPNQDDLWVKAINRIANCNASALGGYEYFLAIKLYPAAILLYATGIAAIYGKRYDLLRKILTDIRIKNENSRETSSGIDLGLQSLIDSGSFPLVENGTKKRHTPLSDIVFDTLKVHFKNLIPEEKEFDEIFDRFEYFFGLAYAQANPEIRTHNSAEMIWIPIGRFSWNARYNTRISEQVSKEIEADGNKWLPLSQGLFTGDVATITQLKKHMDNFVGQVSWRW